MAISHNAEKNLIHEEIFISLSSKNAYAGLFLSIKNIFFFWLNFIKNLTTGNAPKKPIIWWKEHGAGNSYFSTYDEINL
ncbi:hypothetical protein ABW286_22665 [Erwinia papayae]|uniref:Uncharacterized protein n=1 Tax=Erwinia papayae TaxID=206499 RepID=A0ABV3N7Y4_9GAMM|nr:hypothetical protein [Erwinia mallotivora]